MPPSLALLLWLILLLALLRFDPAKHAGSSVALWIPVFWIFFVGSRLPSQWLGVDVGSVQAQALEEGNAVDRIILSLFIVLALLTLITRGFNWGGFIRSNLALIVFLTFALASFAWSDFPLIALKRWFRDLGNYLVILVVLSDPEPLEAVRTVLRRVCYLLIPLSIVIIKYFPQIGIQYGVWTGLQEYIGATTSKNTLGVLCLISGIFFFWDTVTRWSERKDPRIKRILLVNIAFLLMTLRLLYLSRSATSSICLAVGCLVIVLARSGWGQRHSTLIKVMIPASFCLYVVLAFGFDLNGQLASQVGRDPTLTDRTLIWKAVLNEHTNPLIGTGYESFWLGPRLQRVWESLGGINEAHNGYLEVYLNLGAIGVVLVVAFLIASYRNICRKLTNSPTLASLSLAIWTIILFYNVTEAAFKGGLMWLMLLLCAFTIPQRVEHLTRPVAIGNNSGEGKRRSRPPLAIASQRR